LETLSKTAKGSKKKTSGSRLAAEKRAELVGILLLVVALLLAASLVTYQPADPSFLHQISGDGDVANLVGPVGANTAAVTFETFGVAALLIPLLMAGAAWRRLRGREEAKIVGRGIGAVVLLLSLPAILQVIVGTVSWRGTPIPAGGLVGKLIAEFLARYLNRTGAFVFLGGAGMIGVALLLQSTLGDFLTRWWTRIRQGWQSSRLSWLRHHEKKSKEKARRRVMAKHLEREAARERVQEAEAVPVVQADIKAEAPAPSPPMRVTERAGQGSFGMRRVRVPPKVAAPPKKALKKKAKADAEAEPQPEIPFAEPADQGVPIPPLNLLQLDPVESHVNENELVRLGDVIRSRCAEFGVEGSVVGISPGPVITVYEFQPAPGVKVSQIVNLQDDLALALKAESVRIERLAGRSTLGIEVPNKERSLIHLGYLLSRDEFRKAPSRLTVALGTTIHGEPYYTDLATAPHLLVAGATGAGKSVGLQSMITSILYKATRDEVQFIFIDPKRIELGVYSHIPHLKAEVVTEPKKAANALRWAVSEMERRYRLLAEAHVRSIDFYNRAIKDPAVRKRLALSEGETDRLDTDLKSLPYYVIVIDELADLMLVAASEVESSIARIAQMARAVGIHLIIATQRPSVDVLTGTIKANFPCRLSYSTASRHDSRTILDQIGAEKLVGKGDMLFMPPGTSRIIRLHGGYVAEQETAALVRWLKKRGKQELDPAVLAPPPEEEKGSAGGGGADDELFDEAARLVVAQQQASASFLQRRMRIGFSRAARLIDMMEQDGLVGPPQGSKPREVLVKTDYFSEIDDSRDEV
jgi:S-DNA-T family DNA segregation ATPase FtsK/SpoIIIE